MALPTQNESFMPVLKCLYEKNTAVSTNEIKEYMREYFKPSEEDLNIQTKTGNNTFDTRSHWAVVFLKYAELVERSIPGHAQITEAGRKFFEENPEFNFRTLKEKTPYLQNAYKNRRIQEDEEPSDEEKEVSIPFDQYYDQFDDDLLYRLINYGDNRTKGEKFEKFSLELLEAMGYGKGIHNGGTGDGGIDGFLVRDPLVLERIGVQCKCYKRDSRINASTLSEFAVNLRHEQCRQGIFITTSDFETGAKKQLKKITDVKIVLINGKELAEYAREYKIGVKIKETKYIYDIDL